MRLWKKISAMAAMAAMCVSLAVPATVRAEEINARIGGCPGGCVWSEDRREDVLSTDSHYFMSYELTEGGTVIPHKVKCEIEYVKITCVKYCNPCGIMQQPRYEYITRHSKNCDQ